MKRKPKAARPSRLQAEMGQQQPFRSVNQEATVGLLRTASVVTRAFARLVESRGLSFAQYNALRVVRGAGAGGIPTLTIRERMIDEGTTITRLLDKLETAGLIRRERSLPDRRQVVCYATRAGRELLDRIDPEVNALDEAAMSALSAAQVEQLIHLLDLIRETNASRGAPRSATRGSS